MNSNESQLIDIKLAFRQAENIARKRSSKAWFMSNLLIPKPARKYLFLCYAYLRWVDNFIDDPVKTLDEKKNFIQKQLMLINTISIKERQILKSVEEGYIHLFISFALEKKKYGLIDELKNMMEAMRMDVYRLEEKGIFSDKELSCYILLQNKAMFGLVHTSMFSGENYDYENFGKLLWYAGTLRDFFKDVNDGYINISWEDIELYNINLNTLNDKNLQRWLKEKIPVVLKLLESEILILKKKPFKIRLFWSFAYPFYLHKILRIKMYDFSFLYQQRFNFLKEIKASLTAFLTGIKAIIKILF